MKNQVLEILIMNDIYGIDTKKLKEWFKRNGILVLVVFILSFSLGYYKAQMNIELDCKYAKAVRLGATAFECKRIL